MQDVHDEPLFVQRVAGLDIAKAEVEVAIRVPSDTTPGRRQQETRTFGTTRRELESLGDWLACWGVTAVGMEATGDYVVTGVLPARITRIRLPAVQRRAGQGTARQAQDDRADSIWLAKIVERGMISSSFVPPEPIRRLRTHTRYRRHLTQARTAEKQRVEKLLEDGHLKLSSVISASTASRAGTCSTRSPPASATPGPWPSWPAAPCAARSAGWRKHWNAPSSPISTPPCWP